MRASLSDFAAAGGGVTVDSTTILAAIAQAAEQHAAVIFDAKTCNVSREIRLTGQATLLGNTPVNGKGTVIRSGMPGMRAVVSLIARTPCAT